MPEDGRTGEEVKEELVGDESYPRTVTLCPGLAEALAETRRGGVDNGEGADPKILMRDHS